MIEPFHFDCPRCGAKTSEPCRSLNGNTIWPVGTHIGRWRLAGIENPTHEQKRENARHASKMRQSVKTRIVRHGRII